MMEVLINASGSHEKLVESHQKTVDANQPSLTICELICGYP